MWPQSAMWSWWTFSSLCSSSKSLRFNAYVLMILLRTWRIQSFRFNFKPITCIRSLPAWTVRVGWFVDFARHRWDSLSPNVLSLRPSLFSLLIFTYGFALRVFFFSKFLTIFSGHMYSRLVVTFFWVSLPWTHTCLSGGALWSNSNLVTLIQSSDNDLCPSIFQ